MGTPYDANDFKSVLEYTRDEFGKRIFRDASRLCATLCDLAPGLKGESGLLRQLTEDGLLLELEQAADAKDEHAQNRALMKIRYKLEKELFVNEAKTGEFLTALTALYRLDLTPPKPSETPEEMESAEPSEPTIQGILKKAVEDSGTSVETQQLFIKPPSAQPETPVPAPEPAPAPTPKKSKLPFICALAALVLIAVCGLIVWRTYSGNVFGGGITWTLKNGVLTISGKGPMQDYEYEYNFKAHTNIPWWEQRLDITSIVIQNDITSIGDNAFLMCHNLTSVTIPESVTSIGSCAFKSCQNLTNITIPDSVTSIGYDAFYICRSLKSVSVPANALIWPNAFPSWTTVTRRG